MSQNNSIKHEYETEMLLEEESRVISAGLYEHSLMDKPA